MKKIIEIALAGFVAAAALVLLAKVTGIINLPGASDGNAAQFHNTGALELVCNLEVKRPVNGLGQPFEVSNIVMPAGVDFNEGTGWYTGEYAISTNRKGSLTIKGSVLEVSRTSMFSRYGMSIIGEHFTLNRANGEFRQWLDLKGDKKLDLITGNCMRLEKKPF